MAAETLECGGILFLPDLPFEIDPDESPLLSPAILSSAKNASFSVVLPPLTDEATALPLEPPAAGVEVLFELPPHAAATTIASATNNHRRMTRPSN